MDIHNGVAGLQLSESDVVTDAMDLFAPVPREVTSVNGYVIAYFPKSPGPVGPFEFDIKTFAGQYIQLPQTRLYARLRVIQRNNNNLLPNADVSLVNLILSSMFTCVSISLNGVHVNGLQNTYSNYRSYVETLLSYGRTAYKSHLASAIYVMDKAGEFDSVTNPRIVHDADDIGENSGYVFRQRSIVGSRPFEVMIPVPCDFFQINRHFPPGASIGVKFQRNAEQAFELLSAGGHFKVDVMSIKLYVKYISVLPEVVEIQRNKWKTKNMILPFKKTEIVIEPLHAGIRSHSVRSVFSGTLPKSLIIGMVRSDAFDGVISRNPYNFQHFNMSSMSISINGVIQPSDPYELDFPAGLNVRLFRDFYDAIGVSHDDCGSMINLPQFGAGSTLMAFDLSPDRCNGYHNHNPVTGKIDITINFNRPLDVEVSMLMFATFSAVLELDYDFKSTITIL